MYDKKARGNDESFGFRTHKEHINVPIIYFNSKKKIKRKVFMTQEVSQPVFFMI